MNSKQRRQKRRRLERGDQIDRFVAWVNGGAGVCIYIIGNEKSGGNQVYWAARAGTKPGKFTRHHAFKVMGCGKVGE